MLATYLGFIMVTSVVAGKFQEDTVRWTNDYKLDYSDFEASPKINKDSGAAYDTFAISTTTILYHIKIDSGKRKIDAKAIFLKSKSWMIGKNAAILKHEQGHFDITEIYARRLVKMVNEAKTSDIKEFLLSISSSYKQIGEECLKEQEKYDRWTMNSLGEEYYYKWIKEQLTIIP